MVDFIPGKAEPASAAAQLGVAREERRVAIRTSDKTQQSI
jgi:hypothetical protein